MPRVVGHGAITGGFAPQSQVPRASAAVTALARGERLETASDQRLVALARAGSEPAFEAIVQRYRGPLLRHCGRILPAARAEEAVQEAFISAYRAIGRSDATLLLRPWLFRIAGNAALRALRETRWYEEPLDGQPAVQGRIDDAITRSEQLDAVVEAVGALPRRQRRALVARELEGRSYAEISSELAVSNGAVRQLLHRARGRLRTGAAAFLPTRVGDVLALARHGRIDAHVLPLAAGGGTGAVLAKVGATLVVGAAVLGGTASLHSPAAHSVHTPRPLGHGVGSPARAHVAAGLNRVMPGGAAVASSRAPHQRARWRPAAPALRVVPLVTAPATTRGARDIALGRAEAGEQHPATGERRNDGDGDRESGAALSGSLVERRHGADRDRGEHSRGGRRRGSEHLAQTSTSASDSGPGDGSATPGGDHGSSGGSGDTGHHGGGGPGDGGH